MYLFKRNPDPRQKPPVGSRLNPDHPLSQGLVGCWLMNEGGGNKIYDLVTISNGDLYGGPTWQAEGLYLDGTDDYISISNNNNVNVGGNEITVAVLLRPASAELSDNYIVSKYYYYQYKLGTSTTNTYRWTLYTSAGVVDIDAGNLETRNQFVVGTYNATASIPRKLYLDGELVGSDTLGGTIVQYTSDLFFGQDVSGAHHLNGLLIFVLIYNRALSASDIEWLYAEPYAHILVPQYWYMVDFGAAAGGTTASFTSSLSLASAHSSLAHYKAAMSSDLGLSGEQTSLSHLISALSSSTTLSSALSMLANLKASSSDTITFSESLSALAHLEASLSSQLSATGSITTTAKLLGSFSDTISFTETFETAGAATALFTSVLSLGESLSTKASLLATLADSLSLGDEASALAHLKTELTQSFNLSGEFSTQLIAAFQAALTMTSDLTSLAHFLSSLSASLEVTGSAQVKVHFQLNVTDNLSFTDQLGMAAAYIATLVDTLGLSGAVTGVTVDVTGVITVTFDDKHPGISFSAGAPGASFTGRGPGESFS